MDLRSKLVWFYDLDKALPNIVDQHSGLSLARIGTTTTLPTGGPDGGPCISFGNAGGKYRNASVAKTVSYDDGYTVNVWAMSTHLTGFFGNWLINHRSGGSTNLPGYFQVATRTASGFDFVATRFTAETGRNALAIQTPLNTWVMLTLRDTGNVTEIWQNATLIAAVETQEIPRSTAAAPFAIGGEAWNENVNPDINHRGRISMAGVWNEPLSQDEIRALFNDNKGRRYGDLVIETGNAAANLNNTIRNTRQAL